MSIEQIRKKLLKIFNIVFEKDYDDEQIDIMFQEGQFNSIDYIKFVVAVENEFKIEFDDDMLAIHTFRTVYDVAKYIKSLL